MRIILIPLFVMTVFPLHALSGNSLDYKSFYDCQGKDKFIWYCRDEKKPIEKKAIKEPIPQAVIKNPTKTEREKALAEFKAIKKELQERLEVAYINPTEENLKAYISYQNMVTKKAAIFTDTWKRTQWKNPDLDYSIKHPISKIGKATSQTLRNKSKEMNYVELKRKGYGIFFFYRSDCPYCHQMATPIKIFKNKTKLDVLPISIDGVLLNDKFPGSVVDNGQAEELNVQISPSVFLVNTRTKDIIPISYGWVSVNEMKDRIYTLTKTNPGENY